MGRQNSVGGQPEKSLHYERTHAKRVLTAHTEWLQGVQLRLSVPPVPVTAGLFTFSTFAS